MPPSTDRSPSEVSSFDELFVRHLGDVASPTFLRLCRRPSAVRHRAFSAAGWRGVVLATVPGAPSPGTTVRTVPELSPEAVADAVPAGPGSSPAVVSAEAGCLTPAILDALLALTPALLDVAFPEDDRTALAEAQVAAQRAGYAVLVLGSRLVGLRADHADGLAGLADELATASCGSVPAPRPTTDDPEPATLRWAERYFREWRAAANQRDAALAELAELRSRAPEVPTPPAPSPVLDAARRARGAGRRVSGRVRGSVRTVLDTVHRDAAVERGRTELLAAVDATRARSSGDEAALAAALQSRLVALAGALGVDPGGDALAALHGALRDEPSRSDRWWFVHTLLTGSVPQEDEFAELQQRVLDTGAGGALQLIMSWQQRPADTVWQRTSAVEVLSGRVLVDISHTVGTTLRSGVQRVVRNTVPTWLSLGAVPIVYDDAARTWRHLDAAERAAVAAWSRSDVGATAEDAAPAPTVVVPDRCQILVPELKPRQPLPALRAASAHSSNEFRWIVYDLIPILAAQYVPDETVAGSVDYVSTLKHAKQLVAISESSAAEFRGFVSGLGSQGLTGPAVTHELLPLVPPPAPTRRGDVEAGSLRTAPDLPLVLCVSSISPHKNQEVLLSAAARLAATGASFELMFVAPNAWHVDGFRKRLTALQSSGVPVSLVRDVGDEALWSLYRSAHCVVLISRVEGYGLPVAEALSVGTPVVTSDFGSMREVAADGGALMVDPTDVAAVADAVGSLLQDGPLHRSLAAAAAARPTSSWEDYATRTWSLLLDGRTGDLPA